MGEGSEENSGKHEEPQNLLCHRLKLCLPILSPIARSLTREGNLAGERKAYLPSIRYLVGKIVRFNLRIKWFPFFRFAEEMSAESIYQPERKQNVIFDLPSDVKPSKR